MRIPWLVMVVGCGAVGCGAVGCDAGSRPEAVVAPANHVALVSPCEEAFAHSRAIVGAAKLGDPDRVLAQVASCWPDDHGAWAIAIDALCKVPEMSFDNTAETVTLVGRWVVMYMPNGRSALTHASHVYTGDSTPCIDYSHPGNIATRDLDHVVDVRGSLVGHELVLGTKARVLQDHPEVGGTSLLDWDAVEHVTFKNGVIDIRDDRD